MNLDGEFLNRINENIGIASKIARFYADDGDDRKDLQQEMLFNLWRSYPTFAGQSKFSTWMYRVCLNTALTYHRQKAKRQVESISASHDLVDEGLTTNQAELDALFKAIGKLSSLNKAIILLYLEDQSYEEIAGITGLTRSNVSVRLVRIKKELEYTIKQNSQNEINS